jgi:hypothetical protein
VAANHAKSDGFLLRNDVAPIVRDAQQVTF